MTGTTATGGSDGLRPTKVGLYFLLLTAVLALAALNTGNNGLFLVVALMLASALAGNALASRNIRDLDLAVELEGELFANGAGLFHVRVGNRGRFTRRLLVVSIDRLDIDAVHKRPKRPALLIDQLAPGAERVFRLEGILRRRGRLVLESLRVSSLYPLGLFNKGFHYPLRLEWLVFPEIFGEGARLPGVLAGAGHEGARKPGWGHELLSLRPYRSGDDPRSIHWKQSARQGELISQNRELEEKRRLLIVFDNAVGELAEEDQRRRFEALVSEAATTALDFLARGTEVALQTRDLLLPYGQGPRQRLALLEALALIEAKPHSHDELAVELEVEASGLRGQRRAPRQLRFSLPSAVAA